MRRVDVAVNAAGEAAQTNCRPRRKARDTHAGFRCTPVLRRAAGGDYLLTPAQQLEGIQNANDLTRPET